MISAWPRLVVISTLRLSVRSTYTVAKGPIKSAGSANEIHKKEVASVELVTSYNFKSKIKLTKLIVNCDRSCDIHNDKKFLLENTPVKPLNIKKMVSDRKDRYEHQFGNITLVSFQKEP